MEGSESGTEGKKVKTEESGLADSEGPAPDAAGEKKKKKKKKVKEEPAEETPATPTVKTDEEDASGPPPEKKKKKKKKVSWNEFVCEDGSLILAPPSFPSRFLADIHPTLHPPLAGGRWQRPCGDGRQLRRRRLFRSRCQHRWRPQIREKEKEES